jgi:phenylacetate-CoA ligase
LASLGVDWPQEEVLDLHAVLVRRVIGPLWARWERSPYLRHYHWLRRHQFDSPEIIRTRQWTALRNLLRHAYATVPYYRQLFERAGLRPGDIQNLEDFTRVPVLTKEAIRAHGPALLSRRFTPADLARKQTTGSTGVPLTVWVDEESQQWKRGCTLRADEWSGWRFGERVAVLWGVPDPHSRTWRSRLRSALLERTATLNTLHVTEAALEHFARHLQRKKPGLILGHAHSLYLLAEYVRARGPAGVRPRGVISTAMVLHDWQRRAIKEVFGCQVTNRYGCEEVSLIACECERHHGLHVNADGVYVEILRDGRPAAPGEPGAVAVTDLTNRAMPLLRYQVGDVAVWSERTCPCGRGLPLLERVEGREADYVVTADGGLVSGVSLSDNFTMHVPGVAQLQIIQESVGRFRFRIVRDAEFGPASLRRMADLVAEYFGPAARFECEYVAAIPREPSGKFRFCISRVANPFTRPREVSRA